MWGEGFLPLLLFAYEPTLFTCTIFHCTTFCEVTNNHTLSKSNDAFLVCILCHLSGASDSCHPFCKTFLFSWLSINKLSCVFFPISLYIGSFTSSLPLFTTFLRPKPQGEASSDHLFSYREQLIHHLTLPALSPKQIKNPSVSANSLNFSPLEYHVSFVPCVPIAPFVIQSSILLSESRIIHKKCRHVITHLLK